MVNGTILAVKELKPNIIIAEIANGSNAGAVVFIPRMKLNADCTDRKYVPLSRLQFPVRPAFAMTINKSQGQTLREMCLYLPKPVFAHGQFYVALSRCGSRSKVKIFVKDGRIDGLPGIYTDNIVYKEALLLQLP